jgi:hypothetical protein
LSGAAFRFFLLAAAASSSRRISPSVRLPPFLEGLPPPPPPPPLRPASSPSSLLPLAPALKPCRAESEARAAERDGAAAAVGAGGIWAAGSSRDCAEGWGLTLGSALTPGSGLVLGSGLTPGSGLLAGAGSALTSASGFTLASGLLPGAGSALTLRSGWSLGSNFGLASGLTVGVWRRTKVLWVRRCFDLLKASSMPSVSSAASPWASQRHSAPRQRTPVGFEPILLSCTLEPSSSTCTCTCACERWMVFSTAPSWPRFSRPRSVRPGRSLIVPVSPAGTSWYIRRGAVTARAASSRVCARDPRGPKLRDFLPTTCP